MDEPGNTIEDARPTDTRVTPRKKLSSVDQQHYFVLSLLVCICFNIPLGVAAVYLSCRAMQLFESGHNRQGRCRAQTAFYLSMLGMVTSSIAIMIAVFYAGYHMREDR